MNQGKDLIRTCFECSKKLVVRYNSVGRKHTRRNNWGYWTEREEFKNKYICDSCLLGIYNNNKKEYKKNISSSSKRNTLRAYVYKIRWGNNETKKMKKNLINV